MTPNFDEAVYSAARRHAIDSAPEECVGLVVDGVYVPLENLAADKRNHFELAPDAFIAYGRPQAIIHSHVKPQHSPCPSAHDMAMQQQWGIPSGIVWTDGKAAWGPNWFGDHLLDAPLLGRKFMHGIFDCYALIRSWYWQELKIKLPEFPRTDGWWQHGQNLFEDGFSSAGFVEVPKRDAMYGDVLLMTIRSKVPNHGAVMLDRGLIIHHPGGSPKMLSRREPLGTWGRFVTRVVRRAS